MLLFPPFEVGLKVDGLRNHESWKVRNFYPLPTFHLNPLNRSCLPHNMLLQAWEGPCLTVASRKSTFLKYAFNTWKAKELGSSRSLHACFARRAWLKSERSLNLKPPCAFARHNVSHLTQLIFSFHPPSPGTPPEARDHRSKFFAKA